MGADILNASGVYVIRHRASGKVYVGSAAKVRARLIYHASFLRRGRHVNSKLQRAWAKYGADAFDLDALEYVDGQEDRVAREQHWIDRLDACRSGYNIRPVAHCNSGLRASDKTRALMSERGKGRRHTPEAKALISKARRGVPIWTEEDKLRMSRQRLGRKHTDEAKAKIAAASRGRKIPAESVAKRAAACRATVAARGPYCPSAELRLQWSLAKKGRPAKNRKPVVLFGIAYPSITAASEACGRGPQWVKARMEAPSANRQ